jgi:hypothetical protein
MGEVCVMAGRPRCPGALTSRFRDLTKQEVSNYHREHGKWPTPSMAACEVCGTTARVGARGYDGPKIANHLVPEDWVPCDHEQPNGERWFPYACERCGGCGYRKPDVPKADDALPDPPVPTVKNADIPQTVIGGETWFPPGAMANHVNAAPPSMGDVLDRRPIVPPSTPLAAEEVLPGWTAPGVPDPHVMAAMAVGTLRTQLEDLKLPEQIGGGFHTVADIVRPHLDTIAKQIDTHRQYFATERAMNPAVTSPPYGKVPMPDTDTNRFHLHPITGTDGRYTHTHEGWDVPGHEHTGLGPAGS